MCMRVQLVAIELWRHARTRQLMAPDVAQQAAPFHDIRPVVLARVMNTHEHLRPARYFRQRFKCLPGQGADAKHGDTARKVGADRYLRPASQRVDEALMHGSTAR